MELFKRKKKEPVLVQTAPANSKSTHPFGILDKCISATPASPAEIKLYKSLREAVPVIDAAISKVLRLTGEFTIKSKNDLVEKELNKFITNVKVNSCGLGANSFIINHLDQLLTYGTAVGEIVIDSNNGDIAVLYNAPLETVELATGESPLELKVYKKYPDGSSEPIKYPQLILVSSFNPDPGSIYGNSILKGLPFISNILLKIFHSIGVNWERIGNVRFAITYKPPADSGQRAYSKERAAQIAQEWSKAMRQGTNPSDFIAVGDVDIKVIGADNQILNSQVPVRQLLEQIISKLSIPPFLLGINWSTTETMSVQQSEILSSELEAYRRILNPVIRQICDMWLKLHGLHEEYSISWDKIDLKDHVHIANARLINARAQEIEKQLEEKYGKPFEDLSEKNQ